jgi:putative transposase
MLRMGLRTIYQNPRTTFAGNPSERFPCLVEINEINTVDQVWGTEITDIPLRKGVPYLVAVVDLCSRHVPIRKLSNSLDTEFYILMEPLTNARV